MFCYSENCNGCDNCNIIENFNDITFNFYTFTSFEEINPLRRILGLVSSWEEPPYFIVLKVHDGNIYSAFDNTKLENTRILKWAYLPEYKL